MTVFISFPKLLQIDNKERGYIIYLKYKYIKKPEKNKFLTKYFSIYRFFNEGKRQKDK